MSEVIHKGETEIDSIKQLFYNESINLIRLIKNDYELKEITIKKTRKARICKNIFSGLFLLLLIMSVIFGIITMSSTNGYFKSSSSKGELNDKNYFERPSIKQSEDNIYFYEDKFNALLKKVCDLKQDLSLGNEYVSNVNKLFLFSGPSGNGKTFFAKKLAERLNKEFRVGYYMFTPSDINNKFFGESEKIIKGIFEEMKERREKDFDMFVLVFDEINYLLDKSNSFQMMDDGGSSAKNSIRSQLLAILDGCGSYDDIPYILIGTTNSDFKNLEVGYNRRFKNKLKFKNINDTNEIKKAVNRFIKNRNIVFTNDAVKAKFFEFSKKFLTKGVDTIIKFFNAVKLCSMKNSNKVNSKIIETSYKEVTTEFELI